MAQAVIMAGGQGERFWPLTHARFPKYRIRFDRKHSLLQGTYRRLLKVYKKSDIYVVTTRHHLKMICQELPFLKKTRILIEPFRKNTAAAIFFSCAALAKKYGPDEVVSFFPADHLIQNEVLFKKTLRAAIQIASQKEMLVTLGITPAFPATGYGYIQKGVKISGAGGAFKVKRFVEKPHRQKAVRYIRQKDFFWNAGIFTWRTGVFLETLRKQAPEIYTALDLGRLAASYKKLPAISVDHAVLEKADNIAVLPTRMDWCDLGSWDALYDHYLIDKNKNYAEGFYYHKESKNSLLINQCSTPLITLGISGLIVVQTPRGTLICRRGRSEEAALLLKKL